MLVKLPYYHTHCPCPCSCGSGVLSKTEAETWNTKQPMAASRIAWFYRSCHWTSDCSESILITAFYQHILAILPLRSQAHPIRWDAARMPKLDQTGLTRCFPKHLLSKTSCFLQASPQIPAVTEPSPVESYMEPLLSRSPASWNHPWQAPKLIPAPKFLTVHSWEITQ